MNFNELAVYLCGLFSQLASGKTLFINSIPAGADFAVMIRDSYTGFTIDEDIPGLRQGRFQLAGRGNDYEEMRSLMVKISDALTLHGKEFDGFGIKSMHPLNEPVAFMISDGNHYEFSVNFFVIYYLK